MELLKAIRALTKDGYTARFSAFPADLAIGAFPAGLVIDLIDFDHDDPARRMAYRHVVTDREVESGGEEYIAYLIDSGLDRLKAQRR